MTAAGGTLPSVDPLEIYCGMLLGQRRTPLPDLPPLRSSDPRGILDELLLDALTDTPCHVSFSGGRDSSVILAAATAVARREGLPDPVPLTLRYPDQPSAQETDWQHRVVDHLRLDDWRTVEVTDELDLLGDVAQDALRRRGVTAIAPAHSMLFVARQAGEGSLLTGTGGDELFSWWGYRRRTVRHLAGIVPRRRAVKALFSEALPLRVRFRLRARDVSLVMLPWLTAAAQERVLDAWRSESSYSSSWRDATVKLVESRAYEMIRAVLTAYAADAGVRLVEPFFDPRFVRAVAAHGPRLGYNSRDQALEELFSDLLPEDVLRRQTKAIFSNVLMGPRAREFVRTWDGTGVDPAFVDPDALRAAWSADPPDGRSMPAIQQAWLASQ